MYRVTQDGWISSSHQVTLADGSLERLHGHNWRVQVAVEADELDARGLVVDYDQLKTVMLEVLDGLDHTHLNDVPAFTGRPVSAEVIARHVFETIGVRIDDDHHRVAEVRVWMTDEQAASYRT
jgi:6-pyruvoyltetrahydropterin/6-carboxytetrahydropterin synthase